MGIIVDLIIIGIIVLSTFLAYRKGLVALAIKLCAVIISILITLILYRPVSNLIINTTGIDEAIQNAIFEKSSQVLTQNNDEELKDQVLEQAVSGMLPETARELSVQIINICVIIVLFIVVKLLLRFVSAIANKISKLPILNQFNKIGGIIYGILRGLVTVYVLLLLISFAGQINKNNSLHNSVGQSTLGKMMYENNVLNVLIK